VSFFSLSIPASLSPSLLRSEALALLESRVFIENYWWVSQGHGGYFIHPGFCQKDAITLLGSQISEIMTLSTDHATFLLSTQARHSNSSSFGGSNSHRILGLVCIHTEKFEFVDLVDVWDAAFSVETSICRHLGNQI